MGSSSESRRRSEPATSTQVVPSLVALGFSLNESRAYAALLAESPATGYEVGVRAQIPRSAVYGVLRRLVTAGAVRAIAGAPERFVPAAPDDLLSMLRKRFDAQAETLADAVRRMDSAPPVPDAFSVRGYDRIVEEAERIVRGAEKRLAVSGWSREVAALAPELRRAEKRGVYVVVFSHSALAATAGHVFSYGLAEHELESFWRHRLIVVADDRTTLIGATERHDGDTAVVSDTAAIAEVATSQIALDITLLAQRHGIDVDGVMGKLLGERVGELDRLLPAAPPKTKKRARG
ncbi:MAG TPA: helix-turn-helix domain-containing protein [Polyangiaceae bacterium]|jgi:sugar-specific transcriptional regulator TrmB